MRLVLLGSPGSGKGTQSEFIRKHYNIPHIATGSILREAVNSGTELGKQVKSTLEAGHLVSDDLIIKLVYDRIKQADCKNGFLLDGFPRTLPQAQALQEANIDLDYVIEIVVPDSEIISRLSGRRIHPASGRTYHIRFNPPKHEGVDDITGEPLIQRLDDRADTVKKRLEIYHHQTKPIVDYYIAEADRLFQRAPIFIRINGLESMDCVRNNIFKALMATRQLPSK